MPSTYFKILQKPEFPHDSSVKIIIAGDLAPIDWQSMFAHKVKFQINNDIVELLKGADFSLVNLEAPLTETPQPIEKSGPILRSDPLTAARISEFGFKAVTCANNHIPDCGADAVRETIERCRNAGLEVVGCGTNDMEAFRPLIITVKDIKIAIYALAETEYNLASKDRGGVASLYDPRIFPLILEQKKSVDFIIVIIHAGNEFFRLPRPGLVRLCRSLVDIGCDAIVGHHPHLLGGFEIWNGRPIVYSLGNFLFSRRGELPLGWEEGLLMELELVPEGVSGFRIYTTKQNSNSQELSVKLASDEQHNIIINNIQEINHVIADDSLLREQWKQYCMGDLTSSHIFMIVRGSRFIKTFYKIISKFYKISYNEFAAKLLKLILGRYKRDFLNSIRCESHLEKEQTIMELLNIEQKTT